MTYYYDIVIVKTIDKSIIIEEGSLATVIRIEGSKAVVSVSENP